MTKPTVGYGALQGLGDGILAAELTEGGCSVAAIDCKLFCHRPSLTLTMSSTPPLECRRPSGPLRPPRSA